MARMTVGPGDAARCAIGLLLPAWFYTVGLITGAAAAAGAWNSTINTVSAVLGFAFAAGVEILRRIVLLRRPSGGQAATVVLRIVVGVLPIVGLAAIASLSGALATGCLGRGCGDDARIAVWLWLVLCVLCLATTPLLVHLLRKSPWLQVSRG